MASARSPISVPSVWLQLTFLPLAGPSPYPLTAFSLCTLLALRPSLMSPSSLGMDSASQSGVLVFKVSLLETVPMSPGAQEEQMSQLREPNHSLLVQLTMNSESQTGFTEPGSDPILFTYFLVNGVFVCMCACMCVCRCMCACVHACMNLCMCVCLCTETRG